MNAIKAVLELKISKLTREKLIKKHRFKTVFTCKSHTLNNRFFIQIIRRRIVQMRQGQVANSIACFK